MCFGGLFAYIFHPKLCYFLFMRLSAVEGELASLHCVGKLSHSISHKTLD